jgi:predicted phage terminase large subunit-like protein
VAIAADPSGGENPGEYKKGIRDFFVAVAGGRTRDGHIEVFDVFMTKAAPDEQISKLLDMYDRHRPKRVGVEEVMFKNLYKPTIMRDARERGLYPTVVTLKAPRVNKQTRILGVQPLIMDAPHTVRFAAHLRQSVPLFFAQFDEFPAGHDDGPDATEMLIRMLEKSARSRPTGVSGSSYWRKAS